jgi:outer membrane protein
MRLMKMMVLSSRVMVVKRLILLVFSWLLSFDASALSLFDAYQKAIGYDASYAAAQDALNAAQEQPVQAQAQLKPTVSLSLTKRNEAYKLPSTSATMLGYDENSTSQYVQLTQPLYNRKLFYGIDVANSQLSLAQLQSLFSLQDLELRVADAYLSILLYQESFALDGLQIETTKARLEQVNAAMEVGYASTVDVYSLQAELDDIDARNVLDEQQLTIARQQLALLIGEPSPAHLVMPQFDAQTLLNQFLPDKKELEAAVDQNLVVKSKAVNVEMASSDLAVRASDHYPTVSLGAFYANTQSSSYFAQKGDDKVIYIEFDVPLYQGGYVASRVREGQAKLHASQHEEVFAKREATKKIQAQLSTLQSSVDRLKAIDKAIESGTVYLDSVEDGFRLGLRDINEVSRAKERLFSSRRDKISTTVGFIRSLVQLYAETAMLDDGFIRQLDSVIWSASSGIKKGFK